MATIQNSGAGRGRGNGNNPPGGRRGPHKGHYNDRTKPLLSIPRGFAEVLKFCGVGDRYNLCLTCHQPESADHRANWMNCGNCDEHGSAHRGSVCPKLRPMNDDFWRSHTSSSREEVYGRSRSGPVHNEEGQPPTVQAHVAADMAIEDEPSEQQPAVQTSAAESTAQVSNPASDGPIIKQDETEPATKLEDMPATDASQEVSSRMAELETQIQQVAASLSSNRASGIADQLAQLVGEYHSLTLIQEIGADDEERLDTKGLGSSSSG
jgi:hypothetical protein